MALGAGGQVWLAETWRLINQPTVLQSRRKKSPQMGVRPSAIQKRQRGLPGHRKRRQKSIDIGAARRKPQNSGTAKEKRLQARCLEQIEHIRAAVLGNSSHHAKIVRRKKEYLLVHRVPS